MVTGIDSVTTQGGTIVAQGSRWIYTPPAGFLGTDSFSYTMSDGVEAASSTATIEVSENGGIALEITVDGDLTDWPAGHFVLTDPDDISGAANLIDLREIHMTVQNNKLYIAYVNDGPVVYNWAYILYLDLDSNPATGYQVGSIGAEYILEQNQFKQYTGTGEDWAWQTTALVSPTIIGSTAEMSLPLAALGGATSMRLYFIGDNLAYEPDGIGEDLVPDSGSGSQWFSYDLVLNQGHLGDPPIPGTEGVDGDLGDWPAGHFVALDPDDVSGAANKLDLRELHLWAADGRLRVAYVNEQDADYNYAYLLYVDADSNPATGFAFYDIGADFLIQEDLIESYTGSGANWSWAPVEPVVSAVDGDTVELSASLAALGDPANIRIHFYGDNGAYPGGSAIDLVPDDSNTNAYVQFNTATNTGSVGQNPDTDLVPDGWELANGLNPFANDGLLDPEADEVPSVVEWVLDQSPLQPDIEPLLLSLVETDGTVQAMIDYRHTEGAELAVSITLERSTDPLDGPWTALPPGSSDPPAGGVITVRVTDPTTFNIASGAGPLQAYYRLRITGTDDGTPFEYISPMVGYNRLLCPSGSDTHGGFMFRQASVSRADCPAAPVPAATAGQWTVSHSAAPAGMAAGQTVRFESGLLAGEAFPVTAVTPTGFDVDGDLSGVAAGDRYRVTPAWTPSRILGMAGTVLEDSADFLGINRGHELLLFDPRGTGIDRAASAVLYHLPTGWRSTASATAPEDDRRLEPDSAFVIRGTGPQVTSDAWIVIAGAVEDGAVATIIGSGGSDTTVALQSAMPKKLRDTGLVSSGAFEGSADVQAGNRRDELMVYDNTVLGTDKLPSATFYFDLASGLWRSAADPAADAGDVELPPGSFLKIRSASGAPVKWTLPAAP